MIWAYIDDNKSIAKYLANKSSLGMLFGIRSNLPVCETIEINSNKEELKIELDDKSNNDIHLLINNLENKQVLFDAWIPLISRSEINDWEDAFTR